MRGVRSGAVRGDVVRLFEGESVAGLGEGELLDRFATGRDEAAFEALVGRLGPMVLGVCRRMLADPHDVDDAFQATFLVLVRRAGSIRDRDLVAPWLYGVALRVARRARIEAGRRKARERLAVVPEAVEAGAEIESGWLELRALIDEEIGRLPEDHRRAVVLCDVEGLSREEAAARLGWSLNMVRGRLERARGRLRGRLARRGVAPSGAWVALMVAPPIPSPSLLAATTRAALALSNGGLGMGLASASAVALSRGVSRMMMLSKMKLALAACLISSGGIVAVVGAQPGRIAAQDGPTIGKQEVATTQARTGRRLPDVAGRPPGGPWAAPRRDPNAQPDLDSAPDSVSVRISGVVRDLDERPIAGATVYALGTQILDEPKLTMNTTRVGTATTGTDGSYSFPAAKIPTSRYRHTPQAATPWVQFQVMAKAPGFGLGWHEGEGMFAINPPHPKDLQMYVPLGSPVTMNFYLRPEADLKGRVVDEAGKPVADVKVDLHDVSLMDERGMDTGFGANMRVEDWPGGLGRAVTDADGRFRMAGLPSESCCWISFERPEAKGSRWLYASTLAEAKTSHTPEHVRTARGRSPHEVYPRGMTVSMPSTRTIEVRVVADDDGKPVPGAHVSSLGESLATGVAAWGDTDAEGRVALNLPSGKYRGLCADPDSPSSRFVRTYLRPLDVAAEPEVQPVELRMKAGFELRLEAVDEATGKGVADIHLEIRPEKSDLDWAAVETSTFAGTKGSTGADGKLRALLAPTPGQSHRVRVLGSQLVYPATVPPPPPLEKKGLPYDVEPSVSDTFEAAAGKSVTLRFLLNKR